VGTSLTAAAQSTSYLFAGRIIAGFAIGQCTQVVPMYLSEIAPPEFRGALVSIQQVGIVTGVLLAFWLCYGTSFIGGESCSRLSHASFGGSDFNPYTDVPAGGCDGQSALAWRLPLALQNVPAVLLLVGALCVPLFHPPVYRSNADRLPTFLAFFRSLLGG
jgi:MFS family permease